MSLNRNSDLIEKSGQHASAVKAVLNYLAPTKERPRTYTNDPPTGEPRTTVVSEAHVVPIRNLRPFAPSVSLDREGFSLVRQDTAVTDFYDDDEVKAVYYPEVKRALKEATGADRVFIFDHTTRRRVPDAEDDWKGIRQPVARVQSIIRRNRVSNASATFCRRRPMACCEAVSRSLTCGGRSVAR